MQNVEVSYKHDKMKLFYTIQYHEQVNITMKHELVQIKIPHESRKLFRENEHFD